MSTHNLGAAILALAALPALAQIPTDIIDRHRADIEKQAKDPAWERKGGTQPADWNYALPAGILTREVTFFVDGGTALHGKLFLPRGFTTAKKHAGIVVGHGVNAIAIGIEKFACRFAERGLVALAIDYRTYGYSSSEVSLLDPDTTADDRPVHDKISRVQLKRTDLNNFHEIEDYRAAISFLSGEPGVDPERIGIWGTSNAGSVVIAVAAQDARVKAVVSQVAGPGARPATGPVAIAPNMIDDAIKRARTGQGGEIDGGFSFRTKIDAYAGQRNREVRAGSMIDRIPESTKIISILAEKDELIPPGGAPEAAKAFKGTWQVVTIPLMTHFQVYSGTAFEVGSTLAADWFVKYLGGAQ